MGQPNFCFCNCTLRERRDAAIRLYWVPLENFSGQRAESNPLLMLKRSPKTRFYFSVASFYPTLPYAFALRISNTVAQNVYFEASVYNNERNINRPKSHFANLVINYLRNDL